MKVLSLLLGICLLSSVAICQNKFTIATPAGWQRRDTAINGFKTTMLIAPAAPNAFHPNLNVVSEFMRGTTLEAYFSQNISVMGQYMQGFVAGKKGDREIAGVPAKWMAYSQNPNGVALDALFYVVPKDGVAYIITCTVAKGELEKSRAKFEEIIHSFKFL